MAKWFTPAPGELSEQDIPYYGSDTDTEADARAFAADWHLTGGVRQVRTIEHADDGQATPGARWTALDTRPNGPIPRR